jgi:hypothetical protein
MDEVDELNQPKTTHRKHDQQHADELLALRCFVASDLRGPDLPNALIWLFFIEHHEPPAEVYIRPVQRCTQSTSSQP